MNFKDMELKFKEECYGGNQTNYITWKDSKETIEEGNVEEWHDGIEYTLNIIINNGNDILTIFEKKWVSTHELVTFIENNCKHWHDLESAKYYILKYLEK